MVAVEEPFPRLFPDTKRVEGFPVALDPAARAGGVERREQAFPRDGVSAEMDVAVAQQVPP
jgi:hypothetical protein